MYLEKINITEFRVLKDIEICFKTPVPEQTASAETGNVINVLAGVNGCGKTSLYVSFPSSAWECLPSSSA
jgi:recombinational DNA repair ATPase RecF